ncbi:MAG: hypothetical protein M3072_04805 [Candidatus Dormibacteraeota bacterium]|nr:hypothetical protein [Candidatus Dormibacteraeota bacterium]
MRRPQLRSCRGPLAGLLAALLTGVFALACGAPPAASKAPAASASASTAGYLVRGVYGRDGSPDGHSKQMAAGFNTFDVNPDRSQLDALPAGAKAFVWLGGWKKDSCTFERDDATVVRLLQSIRGHSAIGAFFLGDEPLASVCPGGPAKFRDRTALVHRFDARPTFTVIQEYDPGSGERYPYAPWRGTVDIIAIDVYPCSFAHGCNWSLVPEAIAAVDRLHVPYWAVLQDFQDDYYRLPSAAELAHQWQLWRVSRATGYLVFSWRWKSTELSSYPENVAQLATENRVPFTAGG